MIDQAQIGFVDEGGGLQGVAADLAAQVVPGQAPQLAVDEGQKPISGGIFAAAPCLEEPGHFTGRQRSCRPGLRGSSLNHCSTILAQFENVFGL